MSDKENQESLADYGYTAFEKWDYKPFVFVAEHPKPWISFKYQHRAKGKNILFVGR